MFLQMARLGMREMLGRKRMTLSSILGIVVALFVFLSIEAITKGATQTFTSEDTGNLIVQQKGTLGEAGGSFLPIAYEATLRELGAQLVVPEIHAFGGSASETVVLFRGIPLESYASLEKFRMKEGSQLGPGDEGKVMVGSNIAEAKDLRPGGVFLYRGEEFPVKGVFETGTIADNEVWVDLDTASRLFNLGSEVSVFVIRGDEALTSRIEDALPVEVTKEFEAFETFNRALQGIILILRTVSAVMAIAVVLAIANVMFTVVRQRQREMAVLRSIGFGRAEMVFYVMVQAFVLSLLGFLVAVALAFLVIAPLKLETFGLVIKPSMDAGVLLGALLLTLVIGTLSAAYPARLAAGLNIAATMRQE
ncbi:MAG: ABC transporter permease [Chloroflexi bacterium]|nr:ABC transporter permease [Chloroflexota bacterium]